jgi:DNA-binding NarL/FixJ family response regulator
VNELDEEIFNKHNISPREQDVIRLILQGYRNQKIADELSVTVSTIKKHITKIYYKLEVKSRYELIDFFKNPVGEYSARINDYND